MTCLTICSHLPGSHVNGRRCRTRNCYWFRGSIGIAIGFSNSKWNCCCHRHRFPSLRCLSWPMADGDASGNPPPVGSISCGGGFRGAVFSASRPGEIFGRGAVLWALARGASRKGGSPEKGKECSQRRPNGRNGGRFKNISLEQRQICGRKTTNSRTNMKARTADRVSLAC